MNHYSVVDNHFFKWTFFEVDHGALDSQQFDCREDMLGTIWSVFDPPPEKIAEAEADGFIIDFFDLSFDVEGNGYSSIELCVEVGIRSKKPMTPNEIKFHEEKQAEYEAERGRQILLGKARASLSEILNRYPELIEEVKLLGTGLDVQ